MFLLMRFFVVVIMAGSALAQSPVDTRAGANNTQMAGWSVRGESAVIPTADTLLTRDVAYKQLAAQDSLELVLDAAVDTVRVIITVVAADSTLKPIIITCKGTDTVRTTIKPLFYVSARIDSGLALTDTLRINRATGNTHISQIEPKHTTDYVAHFFVTKNFNRVLFRKWYAGVTSTTGAVTFTVKYFRNWSDARFPGLGSYEVIDTIPLPAALASQPGYVENVILDNVAVGKGTPYGRGWIGIFTTAGSAGSDGFAGMEIRGN